MNVVKSLAVAIWLGFLIANSLPLPLKRRCKKNDAHKEESRPWQQKA